MTEAWTVPQPDDDFDAFVLDLLLTEPLPSGVAPEVRLAEIRAAVSSLHESEVPDPDHDPESADEPLPPAVIHDGTQGASGIWSEPTAEELMPFDGDLGAPDDGNDGPDLLDDMD